MVAVGQGTAIGNEKSWGPVGMNSLGHRFKVPAISGGYRSVRQPMALTMMTRPPSGTDPEVQMSPRVFVAVARCLCGKHGRAVASVQPIFNSKTGDWTGRRPAGAGLQRLPRVGDLGQNGAMNLSVTKMRSAEYSYRKVRSNRWRLAAKGQAVCRIRTMS